MLAVVLTQSKDIHAKAVRRALQSKGHEAILLYGSDFPARQHNSISISQDIGVRWALSDPSLTLSSDRKIDVVWYRRPTSPVLPDDMHPADREIARRECLAFYKGFWGLFAPHSFWVNPITSRERASIKPIQLQAAMKSGLSIPETLFSNDPAEIRKFLSLHSGETVYKGFHPVQWQTESGAAMLYTSEIGLHDLPVDEALSLAPGIFQRKLEKAYELRVTFMGDYACSVKLLSQQHPDARVDWRSGGMEVDAVPYELPDEIYESCRILMKQLGIVFGCFDFVVTRKGEYVFLEVNEMGQFLWLEEVNPDFKLLESFCQFLISGNLPRNWRPSGNIVHFADFNTEPLDELGDESLHVPTPDYLVVNDREA